MKQLAMCPLCARTVELEYAPVSPALRKRLVFALHDNQRWDVRTCNGSHKTIAEAKAKAAAERGAA